MHKSTVCLMVLVLAVSACGVLGFPAAKSGECFDWCLDVPIAGKVTAVCYGSQSEMLAAQRDYAVRGIKAEVRK